MLTVDDFVRTGSCRDGVKSFRDKHFPMQSAVSVGDVLSKINNAEFRNRVLLAAEMFGSGYGSGYGYGYEYRSGSGSGSGDGYEYGSGSGSGSGYGYGDGDGYEYGSGDGEQP